MSKNPVILHTYDVTIAVDLFIIRHGLEDSNSPIRLCCIEFIPSKKEFHYYFTVHKPRK